jgi:hypothetical protein
MGGGASVVLQGSAGDWYVTSGDPFVAIGFAYRGRWYHVERIGGEMYVYEHFAGQWLLNVEMSSRTPPPAAPAPANASPYRSFLPY